jgi:thiamine biosynthesis protein ThiC
MAVTRKGVPFYISYIGIKESIEALQFDVTFSLADSQFSGQTSDFSDSGNLMLDWMIYSPEYRTIQGGSCSSDQEV